MNRKLSDIFYDPKTGLLSEDKLYRKLKEQGLKFTHKEIKQFIKNQYVTQVFKPIVRPKYFSTITEDKIRDNYQLDLMIYDRYEYHNYKYILVVIDIYSRYVDMKPMTNRENKTIMLNLKDVIKTMGKPLKFSCDNEFKTKEFEKYCNENNINVSFSEPNDVMHNSIVERFNRTLAGYIKKARIGMKNYNWVDLLPKIAENYNNSYHRMIRTTPLEIFYKKGINKQDVIIVPRNFNVGDQVRIKLKKRIFDKGDELTYSKEVYTILKIENNKYYTENDKYYSANKLKKVSDIMVYDRNVENDDEIEHIDNQRTRKITRKLKQVGIEQSNIVVRPKRTTKQRTILDL